MKFDDEAEAFTILFLNTFDSPGITWYNSFHFSTFPNSFYINPSRPDPRQRKN